MSSFKKCLEKDIQRYEYLVKEYMDDIHRLDKNRKLMVESLAGCNKMLNILRTKISEIDEADYLDQIEDE